MNSERIHTEWFATQASARKAAERLARNPHFTTRVRYAARADGTADWQLEVFAVTEQLEAA